MNKIITIVGARPNFIKIDPSLPQDILHTGQHYDYKMSQLFFKERKLPKPRWNLGVEGNRIGKMIDKIRIILKKEKPGMVIVFGDTNSSLAGAFAAQLENIKTVHIEAGMRSFNRQMPEEFNRIVIDHMSQVLISPTTYAMTNLLKEGIRENVFVVGDPMFDAMNPFLPLKRTKDYMKYILITIHRNFNTDSRDNLKSIIDTLNESNERFYWPMHPRTAKMIKLRGFKLGDNIKIMGPVGYKEMLTLESNAKKIITDSGGVVREAYWFRIPCITVRNETEWLETVEDGWNILSGVGNKEKLKETIENFKGSPEGRQNAPIYGVNEKIKEIIYRFL